MAHFTQFRGQASKDNEQMRMLQQHDVDIKRLWKRLSQSPDYNQFGGLGGSGANQPVTTASGGSGSGSGPGSGAGSGSGISLYSGATTSLVQPGTTGSFSLSTPMGGGTVTAKVPMGIAIENPDPSSNNIAYQIGKMNDGTYEVLNPTRYVYGQCTSTTDCTSGADVSFKIFAGTPGGEADTTYTATVHIRKGVVFVNQIYQLAVMPEGKFVCVDPSLTIRGQPGSDIATDTTGSMVMYNGTGAGTTTGITISGIRNDTSCTVKASKLAYAIWLDGLNGWAFAIFHSS